MSAAGLCGRCLHAQDVHSTRGSVFILCRLSRTDPAFDRYPRLPVVSCRGFAPVSAGGQAGTERLPDGPE